MGGYTYKHLIDKLTETLQMKRTNASPNTVLCIIFLEDEKGVKIEPILMVIVIP